MRLFFLIFLLGVTLSVNGHQNHEHQESTAHYLGNEAVLVEGGGIKAMFDPFFHNDFGIYQKVPREMREAIFEQQAPFDKVRMILVSHAHEDHFSVPDVIRYMKANSNVVLVAPQQAITLLLRNDEAKSFESRLYPIDLEFGAQPWKRKISGIEVEAVRIPHAGWPSRAEVQNMVYRVTFAEDTTVMHLGDADPDVDHYLPFREHWDAMATQLGFPPYWFFRSAEGREILKTYLHVKHAVGVHVPVTVPNRLKNSGQDYFSKPGETRKF